MSILYSRILACRALLLLASGFAVASCDRQTQSEAQDKGEAQASGEISYVQAGEVMPGFRIEDLGGKTLDSAQLNGTPVLLSLWATWCVPCITEMPMLDNLAAEYQGRVRVVTVSQDLTGAKAVGPFWAKHDFAALGSWLDPKAKLSADLGGGQLPLSVLYDAQGRELWRVSGAYDWDSEQARAAIDEAIGPSVELATRTAP